MDSLKKLSYDAGSVVRQVRTNLGFPVNQKLIRVCGLQRSGNHAVINWTIAQEEQKTCFVNGGFPGESPWSKSWGISYPNFPYWPKERDATGAFVSKELFVYSYENRRLSDIEADKRNLPDHIGKSQHECVALVLRDPYNTFASWLRRDTPVTADVIHLWKEYAYEFVGKTNVLSEPKHLISFNAWYSSQDYRRDLAEKLGLTFTDRGIGKVSHHGGGSSFDGRALHGKTNQMDVLKRYHYYRDNDAFKVIFEKDEELRALSNQIFGLLDV
jgi:hypothetical protein